MTATAMGMFRMLSDIGYVLGPIMLGWLADAYGMQTPLWTAAGLLIGVGILFALYAPETYRRGVAS
jgi:MFS family permease